MLRLIIGILIELFSVLYIFGMVIGSYKYTDPLGVTITASIIITIFVVVGGLLIYFGIKMFIAREAVLNIAIESFRENGSIDYVRIKEKLKISEYKARKYILWGYNKKLFFEINQDGIIEPKGLIDND